MLQVRVLRRPPVSLKVSGFPETFRNPGTKRPGAGMSPSRVVLVIVIDFGTAMYYICSMPHRSQNLGRHAVIKYDLAGQKFGRLRVKARAPNGIDTMWHCDCDCGNSTVAASAALRLGRTVSCGCRHAEAVRENGKANAGPRQQHKAAYGRWAGVIKRCFREYDVNYQRYGGAGITVCKGWQEFSAFVRDMGDPPPQQTLDRIDYAGNYSCGKCGECVRNGWPMNCRWVSDVQQQRNKSSNRVLTFRGESRCVAEWAEKVGLNRETLYGRLNAGWSIERALLTPVRGADGNKKGDHGFP